MRKILLTILLAVGIVYPAQAQLFEDFETGSKASYAAADVTLATGAWHFSNALIGSHANDKTIGNRSARVQQPGYIRMNFSYTPEVNQISFYAANFGSDNGGILTVSYSRNNGESWTIIESDIQVTSVLNEFVYSFEAGTNTRIKIETVAGNRINIDDITLSSTAPVTPEPPGEAVTITVAQLASGAYEGQLVRIEDTYIVQTNNILETNRNYTLRDATGEINVRFMGSGFISSSFPLPSMPVTLKGNAGSFSGSPQLEPRSQDDIIEIFGGDERPKSETMDIMTWNIEWFGHASLGPSDVAQQYVNIRDIIETERPDIIGVQEIANVSLFYELMDDLEDYRGFLATFSGSQKTGFIFNTTIIDSLDSGLISSGQTPNDWASRLPLKFVFDATVDGHTSRFVSIVIHAKAFGDEDSFNRRKRASESLYTYLAENHKDEHIIFLGDYNDRLTTSTWSGSSVSPYANFVASDDYEAITYELEEMNGYSFGKSPFGFIDHIIVSTPMAPAYIERSARTLIPGYITNYTSEASDHYPVFARFDLSQIGRGIVTQTIEEARNMGVGEEVTIKGIVTRSHGLNLFLQDHTAAIMIRQPSGDLRDAMNSGDIGPGTRLLINGRISSFNNLLQINDSDILGFEILGQDKLLPRPRYLTVGEILENGADYQSELIRVPNITFANSGSFAETSNYTVSDGAHSTVVRIGASSATDLVSKPIPEGIHTFTGVLGQFSSTMQLLPLKEDDFTPGWHHTITGEAGWRMISLPGAAQTYGQLNSVYLQGFTGAQFEEANANIFFYDPAHAQGWKAPENSSQKLGTTSASASSAGRGVILYTYVNDFDGYEPGWPKSIWSTEPDFSDAFTLAMPNPDPENGGWKIIGNPYTKTLSWSALYADAQTQQVSPVIFYWDSAEGRYLTYGADDSHLALPESQRFNGAIQPFMGVFAEATATNAQIHFTQPTEAILLADSPSQSQIVPPHIQLRLDTPQGEDAIAAIKNYAHTITRPAEVQADGRPSISWLGNDKEEWLLRPADFNENMTFRVRSSSSQVSLTFDSHDMTSLRPAYVRDLQTGDEFPILENEILVLTLPETGIGVFDWHWGSPTSYTPKELPTNFALFRNYPNPFNPTTQISYDLAQNADVYLAVYDMLGRRVTVLEQGAQTAGRHHATFDGSGLASGMYFYVLRAGNFVQTQKMMLLK